ncbi:sulfite exporter TauE/SafE family protein [Streptomyces sp. BV286]|uniref:urease accessory protein UreH domain-containing protein n=1 Tax=unclassified Streptomyces TaxID=2593676 RepID=UPI001C2EF6E2|nr:sulfite exporter TauE/SafE family protein [Streptomyces sp. BV286]MBV1942006.1 sulfite exporter TauE/SafE family protein [Streptomyces sp. BV286]
MNASAAGGLRSRLARTASLRRRAYASCVAVLVAACALVLVPAGTAAAHPLGNFTVNRYDGLVVAPGKLRVLHVEDLAEIPATQAQPDIDKAGMAGWARERCETAAGKSRVSVDGKARALTVGESRARVRPGQAGLKTLRVECRWSAALPKASTSVRFRASVDDGPGWREVTARGDRTTLTSSDVPTKSISGELTAYPEELLSSPADTATASLRVRPGGPALVEESSDAPASSILPRGADRFTRALDDLVSRQDLTLGFAALALGIAVLLGAMHALAPGHGKTIMAATAAARGNATMRDVMPLAMSVTVTHTLGVVALGVLVTAGSAAAPSVIAWLGVTSGVIVTVAGAVLVRRAWLRRDHGHSHSHGHGHSHSHGPHGHSHSHAQGHSHAHSPSPVLALAHAQGHGDGPKGAHAHGDGHEHGDERTHAHTGSHTHDAPHTDSPVHGHDAPHTHDDGHHRPHTHPHPHTHSHSSSLRLKDTLLLGFAGGLVPSPSAVVVLVGAAALGKAWFGLLLVLAFGAGLALTLTAAGFAVVKVGSRVSKAIENGARWSGGRTAALLRRTTPIGSAFVVVALGAGLVFKGAATALG